MFRYLTILSPIWVWFLTPSVLASCEPSPAFNPPTYSTSSQVLNNTFTTIEQTLQQYFLSPAFNTSSTSIEVTSSKKTLWSLHHTAKDRTRGTKSVNGSSTYRIGSITKIFTTLGVLQQHAAGKLHLDDSIDKFIPQLQQRQYGGIQWNNITLRTLASQLSGIPNNFVGSDLLDEIPDPTAIGLPSATSVALGRLPDCDSYSTFSVACGVQDLLAAVRNNQPVYSPKQSSTYSNIAFDLLGIALANVTGKSYEAYITSSILKPLGLHQTSFETPADSTGAISVEQNNWNINQGVQNATGGLYSTSNDLSVFLRYILNNYNTITSSLNWLQPASYASGLNSFYGAPWEIFRTDKLLNSTTRPVTLYTKAGSLPGSYSYAILIPEYDLAITILLAGDRKALISLLSDTVGPLVQAAEILANANLKSTYAGTYTASTCNNCSNPDPNLNSSITLDWSGQQGLFIKEWISNGTDFLSVLESLATEFSGLAQTIYFQVVPTFQSRDQGQAEVWRFVTVLANEPNQPAWSDFCVTDVDPISYAGVPLNEILFYKSTGGGERMGKVEFPVLQISLGRE